MTLRDRAVDLATQGYDVEQIRAALLEEVEEACDAADRYIRAYEARERYEELNAEGER